MTKRWMMVMAVAAVAMAQPQPKQPQPKSEKELQAVMTVQNAADPDARVKAAAELLAKFKDTDFKEWALQMQTLSYQQKNDFDNMIITGELTLEVNPDNVVVLITLAQSIPQRVREHDLDKDEKLGAAEKHAKKAMALIPNLTKFNPQITDEEWSGYKRGAMSQVHEALGMVAYTRKDWPSSESAFKAAVDVSPQPDPTTMYRFAMVYAAQDKIDPAISLLNQAIAAGGVKIGDKDLAAEKKAELEKAKAAAKPAAPPPQVEIKRQ